MSRLLNDEELRHMVIGQLHLMPLFKSIIQAQRDLSDRECVRWINGYRTGHIIRDNIEFLIPERLWLALLKEVAGE